MANPAYQGWYKTARWQSFRAEQLRREPLCRMCLRAGRMTKAEVADHIVPHKGNPSMFWSSKNMQSLCLQHGNGEKQRIENGRSEKLPIGVDGFPLEEGD